MSTVGPFMIFLMIGVIPMGIIGIVNGAKAIKGFKEAKNAAKAKPIATLILGIAGIVYCATALIVDLCSAVIFMCAEMLNMLG